MAKDLKVGERVAVYTWDFDEPKDAIRLTGVVHLQYTGGSTEVKLDEPRYGSDEISCHPFQLRRLRKRVAREITVTWSESGFHIESGVNDTFRFGDPVVFREVLKK